MMSTEPTPLEISDEKRRELHKFLMDLPPPPEARVCELCGQKIGEYECAIVVNSTERIGCACGRCHADGLAWAMRQAAKERASK